MNIFSNLATSVPTTANANYCASIVEEKSCWKLIRHRARFQKVMNRAKAPSMFLAMPRNVYMT